MPTPRRAPSMADVAQAAGVSHQTVSRVLNDSGMVRPATRERVLDAIARLGYRRNNAARLLVTNRSHRIGLISAHTELYGPARIASAVQQAGHAAGYAVSIVGLPELTAEALQGGVDRLLDEAVEAIVIAVAHTEARHQARALDLPLPVVLVQGISRGESMAVAIDQEVGARLAVEHLLDLGHRRVAHLTGPLDWIEVQQRRTGWLAVHEERGLEAGPELAGDWSAQSGYDAGRSVAESDVTAVFCANDTMALGLLRSLHERGIRVPEDLSVVGFDDVPEAAFFWPGLTTVTQAFPELGERALDLALRALEGEPDPAIELIVPELVVRDSTAPPAGLA